MLKSNSDGMQKEWLLSQFLFYYFAYYLLKHEQNKKPYFYLHQMIWLKQSEAQHNMVHRS